MDQHAVGDVLVVISATIALTFVIIYHLSTLWWRTSDGRHVMSFMSAIAAVLTLGVVRLVFGTTDWFEWVRTVVFTAIPVVLGWRLKILIQAQFSKRRNRP